MSKSDILVTVTFPEVLYFSRGSKIKYISNHTLSVENWSKAGFLEGRGTKSCVVPVVLLVEWRGSLYVQTSNLLKVMENIDSSTKTW